MLGPPTTRRWSYAASKYYDEHLALRMAEEERPEGHDPALLQRLRRPQPPVVVGRPAVGLLRGPARRPGDGDPRRRPPDPLVHLRERHGRRLRPRPGAPGDLGRGHQHRQRPADRDRRARAEVQDAMGIDGPAAREASSRSRRSAATTRTSGTACPTSPRPSACSASSRRSSLEEGLREDARLAPRAARGRRPSRSRERSARHRRRRRGRGTPRPRLHAVDQLDAALMSIGTLASGVLAYAFNVLAARALGPEAYGAIGALWAGDVPARRAAVPAGRADRLARGGRPRRARRGRPAGGPLGRLADRGDHRRRRRRLRARVGADHRPACSAASRSSPSR